MLKDIAQINTGHLFRYKPDYVESGGYPVIQMKDVLPGEPVKWQELGRVRVESVKDASFARKGDVLVKSKGVSHLGTSVGETLEDTIVSSHIIIIRLQTDAVLPEYLAWYINQGPAQQNIDKLSVGSNIKHLSIKRLGGLPVAVPDIDTQQLIVNLCRLRLREKQLTNQIQSLREQLLTSVMLKKANNFIQNEEL